MSHSGSQAMKRILPGVRLGGVCLLVSLALAAQASSLPRSAGSIVAVAGQGGVVFTNATPAAPPSATASPRLSRRPAPPPSAIGHILDRAARRYHLDPRLVREVARQESDFDASSISSKGALGLMQLMPETARDLGVRHPFDPAENADGGARYLKSLLGRFGGDIPLTLAAYNAGPGSVERFGDRIPPFHETRDYVKTITRRLGGACPASCRPIASSAHVAPPVVLAGRDPEGNPVFTNLPQ